jgi:hypothetical protein
MGAWLHTQAMAKPLGKCTTMPHSTPPDAPPLGKVKPVHVPPSSGGGEIASALH